MKTDDCNEEMRNKARVGRLLHQVATALLAWTIRYDTYAFSVATTYILCCSIFLVMFLITGSVRRKKALGEIPS